MTRNSRFLNLALATIAAGAVASAATRYVATSGADTGDCSSSPCRTIQYAVNQASAGDTVKVASGTYAETVSVTKRLTLTGNAKLNAAGFDNGFVISGAGSSGTVLRNFTVENAGREGIFAVQTSNLTIDGNTLINNDAYGPNSPQCPAADPDDCGEALHLQSVTNSIVSNNMVQHNVGGILLTDENGPTSGNLIVNNQVFSNTKDCGITLASHWFQLGSPAAPNVAGVYQNTVLNNTSNNNGAAGIGVFTGPPGGAAWGNIVTGNTARNNGLPGVALHSHSPFQNLNGNVITNNTLSGNGPDDDAGTINPTGITVWSAVVPIANTTVMSNTIINEYYGIFIHNTTGVVGLNSNNISPSVKVPIEQQ